MYKKMYGRAGYVATPIKYKINYKINCKINYKINYKLNYILYYNFTYILNVTSSCQSLDFFGKFLSSKIQSAIKLTYFTEK